MLYLIYLVIFGKDKNHEYATNNILIGNKYVLSCTDNVFPKIIIFVGA